MKYLVNVIVENIFEIEISAKDEESAEDKVSELLEKITLVNIDHLKIDKISTSIRRCRNTSRRDLVNKIEVQAKSCTPLKQTNL